MLFTKIVPALNMKEVNLKCNTSINDESITIFGNLKYNSTAIRNQSIKFKINDVEVPTHFHLKSINSISFDNKN